MAYLDKHEYLQLVDPDDNLERLLFFKLTVMVSPTFLEFSQLWATIHHISYNEVEYASVKDRLLIDSIDCGLVSI